MDVPAISQESVLRLLLVEDRLEDAERIISSLRNTGMAVRPYRPESLADLETALRDRAVDMVLASVHSQTVPLAQVMATVGRSAKDVAVLATTTSLDEETFIQALDAGANAVALSHRSDHLHAVVCQEFAVLQRRRDLRRLEASLRESERRCDALINSSRDPIAYVHEGMHIRANEAYLEMFGYESFEDIEGLPILDMIAPSHLDTFKQLLVQLGKGDLPPRSLELMARRADGTPFEATMEFAHASYEGEDCLQMVFRPQLLDQEMARELDELRQRDPVTGLFNRQHFLQELETAVAEAAKGRADQALLLIAPDNLSQLLTGIGLDNADALLTDAANHLVTLLDPDQVVARFSDHEFAVLCRGCPHPGTQALADRIGASFREHIVEVGERSLNLTVSIGGVQIGERIASVPQVLAKAAECLATAAGIGGNRSDIFDPAASDRAEHERMQAWVERIRDGVRNNGFLLHYQPIIALDGGTREHYEAFLRMTAGAGAIVKPESFMAIAEEHGLLPVIDRWAISKAIEVLAKRRAAGHDTVLFVKITPASLAGDGLVDFIGDRLAKFDLPGDHLVLELEESKVFTHLKSAQAFQTRLADLGVRVALEKFGAGLNSFQLLDHFDPQFLKIDRSLMEDLGKSQENQGKVKEIAARAREAGMLSIADYVQDAASMSVLFTSGVDYVKGHFLASAGPEMSYDFSQ